MFINLYSLFFMCFIMEQIGRSFQKIGEAHCPEDIWHDLEYHGKGGIIAKGRPKGKEVAEVANYGLQVIMYASNVNYTFVIDEVMSIDLAVRSVEDPEYFTIKMMVHQTACHRYRPTADCLESVLDDFYNGTCCIEVEKFKKRKKHGQSMEQAKIKRQLKLRKYGCLTFKELEENSQKETADDIDS